MQSRASWKGGGGEEFRLVCGLASLCFSLAECGRQCVASRDRGACTPQYAKGPHAQRRRIVPWTGRWGVLEFRWKGLVRCGLEGLSLGGHRQCEKGNLQNTSNAGRIYSYALPLRGVVGSRTRGGGRTAWEKFKQTLLEAVSHTFNKGFVLRVLCVCFFSPLLLYTFSTSRSRIHCPPFVCLLSPFASSLFV